MSKRIFDLEDTENRENYKLLSGLIVPRPIGWIGTRRDDDSYNLAPFSFFNVIAANPPTVIFSAGRHPDRPKDSVAFAEPRSHRDFVTNHEGFADPSCKYQHS